MIPTRPQWRALIRVYKRNVRGLVAPRTGAHRFAASALRHLEQQSWIAWNPQRQGWALTPAGLRALDDGDHTFMRDPCRPHTPELLTLVSANV